MKIFVDHRSFSPLDGPIVLPTTGTFSVLGVSVVLGAPVEWDLRRLGPVGFGLRLRFLIVGGRVVDDRPRSLRDPCYRPVPP